jgi:hypothetical protein
VADAKGPAAEEFPDRTWEAHRRRQATNGLKLTPAERLRWLEDTMEQMRRWVGRARHGRPIGRD